MPLDLFLRRAVARIQARDLFRAIAAASAAAAVLLVVLRLGGASLSTAVAIAAFVLMAVAGSGLLWARRARTPRAAAALVERHDPSLRNLLVTAEQLLEQPALTRAPMRDRVFAEASRRAAGIDLGRAIPLARDSALAAAGVGMLVIATTVALPARSVDPSSPRAGDSPLARFPDNAGFTLALEPPAYAGRQSSTLTDPASIEVLAGTRGTFQFGARQNVRLRVNGGEAQPSPVTFSESGFVAIDGGGLDRLVPLTVLPDRSPDVRITAPAKDLRVSSTAASIPIAGEASDDLGLQSLELRYTIVSGTGEQFSFTEGTLPASIGRSTDRAWKLEAMLPLATMKLEPGDALIYRAVAKDKRPGDAGMASSDTFFVEVAGPGDVPLEGVEMPPDKERYALSQAMIVLKIERLMARETSIARDALVAEAGNIGAEQRAVRANFIFLLGGEIEDEEVEAEHSNEITEGRLANQARRDISTAIALMGRVEKALGALSTREALPPARDAVKALQRAFGHSRYLLRALPSRARIDPARRLSGDVSAALDWSRILTPPASDPVAEAARSALRDLAVVARTLEDGSGKPEAGGRQPAAGSGQPAALLDRVAERLLAAANPELQAAAREILAARSSLTSGRADQALATLKKAAAPLVKHAQRGRIDGASIAPDAARLAGAAAIAGARGRR